METDELQNGYMGARGGEYVNHWPIVVLEHADK
jgi:hypothetical protein